MNDFSLFQYGSFRAEFIIVLIIVNSVLLRLVHMPFLNKISKSTSASKGMTKKMIWHKFRIMFLSGAVSLVSWFMVIVLSALKGAVTLNFVQVIGVYIIILIFALMAGQIMIQHFLSTQSKDKQYIMHYHVYYGKAQKASLM